MNILYNGFRILIFFLKFQLYGQNGHPGLGNVAMVSKLEKESVSGNIFKLIINFFYFLYQRIAFNMNPMDNYNFNIKWLLSLEESKFYTRLS
jgi:hypothetical protein